MLTSTITYSLVEELIPQRLHIQIYFKWQKPRSLQLHSGLDLWPSCYCESAVFPPPPRIHLKKLIFYMINFAIDMEQELLNWDCFNICWKYWICNLQFYILSWPFCSLSEFCVLFIVISIHVLFGLCALHFWMVLSVPFLGEFPYFVKTILWTARHVVGVVYYCFTYRRLIWNHSSFRLFDLIPVAIVGQLFVCLNPKFFLFLKIIFYPSTNHTSYWSSRK